MAFDWFKKEKDRSTSGDTRPPENRTDSAEATAQDEKASTAQKAPGLLKRLTFGLAKTRKSLSGGLERIFSGKRTIDDELLEELEELLITADIGFQTTVELIETVSKSAAAITDVNRLKNILKDEIVSILEASPASDPQHTDLRPYVVMVVGVNGVGKTTTIGKLAAKATASNQKVLIAAADTFRAAAIEQLEIWSQRAGADIVKHKEQADPSAVVFDSIEAAIARRADRVFIDTAGRLHTKVNLMEELKKIKRTAAGKLPGAPHEILMVLDATTGQNALSQAKIFHETLDVTSLAVTKLDGTAKGGMLIGISKSLNIPIRYVGVGETIDDLQVFDAGQYADALF